MAYALFNENSYKYFGENNCVLFSADNAHIHLFDYITKDLSCLSELLEQYILQRMDIATFELKEQTNSTEYITRIKEILLSVHPYYEHEYRKVILHEIGDYFNNLLAYSYYCLKFPHINITEKKWYTDRITPLMQPLLQAGDTYPTDFYNKLQKWLSPEGYLIEEFFIPDIPQKMPIGFNSEIETQISIYNMLYFILDISALGIKELTIPQRMWLYGNIFYGTYNYSAEMSVKQQLTFWASARHQYEYTDTLNSENGKKINETFNQLYSLRRLNIGRDGIPANLMEYFNSAVENAKSITTTATVYEKYEINNLYQLLYLEIISMIKSNIMIRKCKNCGKYFVANNRKTVYCNRIDKSGTYCSAVGANRSFQQKLVKDEALKIYTRAYKTHFARTRKKKMTQEDFSNWCTDAKENLNKVRAGTLDISTFQEWLKK